MNATMIPSPTNASPIDELTYEQAFTELEEIISALEEEDHPLEETLSMFERGQALARHCTDQLDKAELKIRQLTGEDLTDFEIEEG